MSLYTLIAAGFTPLGAFVVTGFSSSVGLENAILLAGIGIIVVVISAFQFIRRNYPQIDSTPTQS